MPNLICGTCGRHYTVPVGVKSEHDQDKGYGICPKDKKEESERNEVEWVRLEKLVADSLSPENSKQFQEMEMEVRRGLILTMMEEGLFTFKIVA